MVSKYYFLDRNPKIAIKYNDVLPITADMKCLDYHDESVYLFNTVILMRNYWFHLLLRLVCFMLFLE